MQADEDSFNLPVGGSMVIRNRILENMRLTNGVMKFDKKAARQAITAAQEKSKQ